ncbi:MAG TPA: isochorismatase family protein [Casimicrobiaceae bacterium]|nr:isochorismatase family protein [Casimicrobiaceae bacterium]
MSEPEPTSSRDADYRSAGFAGKLGFGKRPAVIVIDMVMAYFDRTSPMYAGVEAVAESARRVVDAALSSGVPVFFTQQFFDDALAGGVYARKVRALQLLRRDSALAELHPSVPVERGTIVVKRFPSAFHGTGLNARLRALQVDTLIVTGLTTSGCVRATAMDALLHDFIGVVVREAVGDRDARAHEANLFDIHAKLADVQSEGDVIGWLSTLRAA